MRKIFLATALLVSNFLFAQRTILHCGKLIDVKSLQVLNEMTIIIEDNKIVDVQKGYAKAEANDKVIELKDKTVMPGLIDCHVHLEGETSPDEFEKQFTDNKTDIAFKSTVYAKTTLMAGFTTVRDVGGSGVNISLRNAINKGIVIGPTIKKSY